jgi:PAS domain S-box-containing protein
MDRKRNAKIDRQPGSIPRPVKPKAPDNESVPEDSCEPVLVFAKRYQAFFESTGDAIGVFNDKGEVLDANPRFIKMTGYSFSQLTGKTVGDLLDPKSGHRFHKSVQTLFNGRKIIPPLEGTLITSKKEKRIVEIGINLLRNQYGYSRALFVFFRDISKRKELESTLINRAEELQRVFDAVPTILMVLDEHSCIRRINRAGLEYLGKSGNEVLNQSVGRGLNCSNVSDKTLDCKRDAVCRRCVIRNSLIRCLNNGECSLGVDVEVRRRLDPEELVYYSMNCIALNFDEKQWCVLSLSDVTERKKQEFETRKLNEDIARANLELKKILDELAKSQSRLMESQKMEQIGLLASGLAHNLRTPLSAIKGYAQFLKMERGDIEGLDIIIQEAGKMEAITNNLTLKSRKEHENQKEWLNLNELLKIELEFLSANMFYKHQVVPEITLDENLPMIRGIYGHFSQAILNIVQNALDAMYGRDEKMLTLSTSHDSENIYVRVGDTGEGIPENIRDKIFDLFFTTKPDVSQRQQDEPRGTGLGLSSAAYYLGLYGGRIQVDSEEGAGTEVTIEIPLQKKNDKGINSRVLIVDDSQQIMTMVSEICRQMGMEAYSAKDGKEALELHQKIQPDLVITDLLMPVMNGREMMGRIRRQDPFQRVVYITGYADNSQFRDWLDEENRRPFVSALVSKPFRIDNLKKVISEIMKG